jgi:hypothetical protein
MTPKDVGVRIRVDRELRDAFHEACAAENREASDLLREFMRSFAARQLNGLQRGLFTVAEPQRPYLLPNKREPAKPARRAQKGSDHAKR